MKLYRHDVLEAIRRHARVFIAARVGDDLPEILVPIPKTVAIELVKQYQHVEVDSDGGDLCIGGRARMPMLVMKKKERT